MGNSLPAGPDHSSGTGTSSLWTAATLLVAGFGLAISAPGGTAADGLAPTREHLDWPGHVSAVSGWQRSADEPNGWRPVPAQIEPRVITGDWYLPTRGASPWDRVMVWPDVAPPPLGWLGELPPDCDPTLARRLRRANGDPGELLLCPGAGPLPMARNWRPVGAWPEAGVQIDGPGGPVWLARLELELGLGPLRHRARDHELSQIDTGRWDGPWRSVRRHRLELAAAGLRGPRASWAIETEPGAVRWVFEAWHARPRPGQHMEVRLSWPLPPGSVVVATNGAPQVRLATGTTLAARLRLPDGTRADWTLADRTVRLDLRELGQLQDGIHTIIVEWYDVALAPPGTAHDWQTAPMPPLPAQTGNSGAPAPAGNPLQ